MKSVLISSPPCFYDSQLQIMCCYIERHYVHEGGGGAWGRNRIDPKIARASSILQLCYSNDYYCKNRHYGSLMAMNNKIFCIGERNLFPKELTASLVFPSRFHLSAGSAGPVFRHPRRHLGPYRQRLRLFCLFPKISWKCTLRK